MLKRQEVSLYLRNVKIYKPPCRAAPMEKFISMLDSNLQQKLKWQLFRLSQAELCDLKEPHFKHFVLERYNRFYELREKNKILVRIIFTIDDSSGDIILLVPFIKRQPRDTMRALEASIGMLAEIRKNPDCAVKFEYFKEVKK